jgi:hypothetical protein
VLALIVAACKQGPGEPAKSSGSGSAAGTAAATPSASADWPCANRVSTSTGTEPAFRYQYGGPSACTTTPDLVITGCPTLETLDENGDGTIERYRSFRYDAGGRLVGAEYRRTPDGPVNTRLSITYTADGVPARSEADEGADGTVDVTNVYERKGGALVRKLDRNNDGAPDLIATTTYDSVGRPVETSLEQGGKVAATATYRWEGARLLDETTRMQDMELVTTYLYDCAR